MDTAVKPIAIVQGAASSEVQALLRRFVAHCPPVVRIAGVIEDGDADCETGGGLLRSIRGGGRYPVFQELGAGSTGCSLDPTGLVAACEAVRRDIAVGCDLVVLSKFGKLEAEQRSGLMPAFVAAMEAGVPILTAVSPRYAAGWQAFAAPFFAVLEPDSAAIEAWGRAALAPGAAARRYEAAEG
jgi:hypothetical protein